MGGVVRLLSWHKLHENLELVTKKTHELKSAELFETDTAGPNIWVWLENSQGAEFDSKEQFCSETEGFLMTSLMLEMVI